MGHPAPTVGIDHEKTRTKGGPPAGMILKFGDGTSTSWNASANDQGGYNLNDDQTQGIWHYRRVDLSSFAGKTITEIEVNAEIDTGSGNWDIYFNDISLTSADGTVRPIYSRETSVSMSISGSSGVTNRLYEVNHVSNEMTAYDPTTTYFHVDQVSSGRMTTSVNGYPVWQATYLPFGYEYGAENGVNKFKFATYQRDLESGLDYAKHRYYSSQFDRFLTPDPIVSDMFDPQSLNRYAYVTNNPLIFTDQLGLYSNCTPKHPENCSSDGSDSSDDSDYSDIGLPFSPTDWTRRNCMADWWGTNIVLYGDTPTYLPSCEDRVPRQISSLIGVGLFDSGKRRGGGKGERKHAAKPGGTPSPAKHVRPANGKPGQWEVQNPHTGKWVLKPRGWQPSANMDITPTVAPPHIPVHEVPLIPPCVGCISYTGGK